MSIASRRRALMGAQKSDILFQKKNWTFSGGNLVTGIKLLETDIDFSIAMDVVTTTNPTSGDGSTYRLIRLIDGGGQYYALGLYKNTTTSTAFSFRWMTAVSQTGIGSPATGRHRFVMTHVSGSGSLTIKYRKNNGTAQTETMSAPFTASQQGLVMGQASGASALPSGTLNELTVYSRVLSSSEINSFLGL